MVGAASYCHLTGAPKDGPGIGDDSGRRSGGHSACAGRRAHGSKDRTTAGGLHKKAVERKVANDTA